MSPSISSRCPHSAASPRPRKATSSPRMRSGRSSPRSSRSRTRCGEASGRGGRIMKVCIYGAGSIGGVIASRLALSGVETAVVVRGEHLAAIRANGLKFVTPDGSRIARVVAAGDPGELGPQDVVITAVKAHQLPPIAEPLQRLLHKETVVV